MTTLEKNRTDHDEPDVDDESCSHSIRYRGFDVDCSGKRGHDVGPDGTPHKGEVVERSSSIFAEFRIAWTDS